MKRLVALIAAISLSGCIDQEVGHDRGIPAIVFQAAEQQCSNSNSSLDRIYLHSVTAAVEYLDRVDVAGDLTRTQVYFITYKTTTRCHSNAKFLSSTKLESLDTDQINSETPTPQNGY